jgi:hypothetical protein
MLGETVFSKELRNVVTWREHIFYCVSEKEIIGEMVNYIIS